MPTDRLRSKGEVDFLKQNRETTLLPPGVNVYFPRESLKKRQILNELFDEAARWDFGEIDLPTLDYYDSITQGVSKDLALRTYQFQDDEGELLALRPDATAQVAKILSGRFNRDELAGRYCYSCRNFRAFELRRGELREFQQFGAEILSEDRGDADLELLMFLFEIIETLDIDDLVLDLGHVDVYKGLLEDVDLTDSQSEALWKKIHRKNTDGLRSLLEELPIPDQRKEILRTLPTLYGGKEIFDRVEPINGASESARRAIDELRTLYDRLESAGVSDKISLDLGVVRDLDYYTGIVFEGLVPGLGKPVIGGGRYDTLYGHYGESIPATGFALEIDRLLTEVSLDTEPSERKRVWCPTPTPEARESLAELREQYRVDVSFSDPPEQSSGLLVDSDGQTNEL
jgi:ATP phosphoribosyltransferase regulatory subunit